MSATSSRRKPQGQAPYQIPKQGKGSTAKFCLNGELKEKFCQLYPTTLNYDMCRLFGISGTALARMKRSLGLKKDMKEITPQATEKMMETCRKNGYYASLKGKRPSDACLEATRRRRREGFNPIRVFEKRNPEELRRIIAENGKRHSEAFKRERRRLKLGLPPITKLNAPEQNYTPKQMMYRHSMKEKYGYILGDYRERYGERWVIYYDSETKRSRLKERNAARNGFQIKELKE